MGFDNFPELLEVSIVEDNVFGVEVLDEVLLALGL
jgi:hypothetical protein